MTLITMLFLIVPSIRAYKRWKNNDHFQLERNNCELACFQSAETEVEALPGESVTFECKVDKEDVEVKRLWTTDDGVHIANNLKSFWKRYEVFNNASTLRINPVRTEDNEKDLWCNLLIFDPESLRWRPRKTIRHFLYVGEGKMKITPKDIIDLDIVDDNVVYHHSKVKEVDSEQLRSGNFSDTKMSVENIFANGTMEKDELYEDVESGKDGAKEGTVKEKKEYLDLGEKFKKTIEEGEKMLKANETSVVLDGIDAALRSASNGAKSLRVDVLPPRPTLSVPTMEQFLKRSLTIVYVLTSSWMSFVAACLITGVSF